MMDDKTPKSLDVFLGLLGEIDIIKNQISSLDKDTHIILAHDEVSSLMGNAECFRILKLIEVLNANICGLNASILSAAEHMTNLHPDVDFKENNPIPENIINDEDVIAKMNEMMEKEMRNKAGENEGTKEEKKDNEIINNMLSYFKERFEGNGRE